MEIKQFTFNLPEQIPARNRRECLIYDIAEATSEKNKEKLRKVLAIKSNQLGWTETDLHYLYQRRQDPKIRNYTAFVWWSLKTKSA